MNIDKAKEIVISEIKNALEGKADITEDMHLIGGETLLDSMKLVEVCLALEDVADEHGFEFDWTTKFKTWCPHLWKHHHCNFQERRTPFSIGISATCRIWTSTVAKLTSAQATATHLYLFQDNCIQTACLHLFELH